MSFKMQQHYKTVHLTFNLPNFILNISSTCFLSFVILTFQSSFTENQKWIYVRVSPSPR